MTVIDSNFVKLGRNVKIWHPSFVNIYGTSTNPTIIGDDVSIAPFVEIQDGCSIGQNCVIHSHVFIASNTIIGRNVFIGSGTIFCNDRYPRAKNKLWKKEPVYIDDFVSIGANCTILSGVTIGKYSIIGAGSVVTKNVPEKSVFIGNPAKFRRFLSETELCLAKLD